MSRATDRSLPLGPAKRVQAERRPVVFGFSAGIDLLRQIQQVQMAGRVRTEAGHFDVVTQSVRITGLLGHVAREEPFLVIETRSPGQTATDL